MPPSKTRRFKQLELAVKILNKMLPPSNITGKYTMKQQTIIKAYRLLCHAEIEAYIEDIASDCITKAHTKWNNGQKKSVVLVNFFAIEGWSVEHQVKKDTNERLCQLISLYKQKIKDNNGLKEKNIKALFLPLGVDLTIINTLMADLDALGVDRGAIAHTAMKTHSVLDPGVEQSRINQIVSGLEVLDNQVRMLS